MSATIRRAYAPAPFTTPAGADIDMRMAMVAEAINRKADTLGVPPFQAVTLRSPNGSTWRVSVTDAGSLITEQVLA